MKIRKATIVDAQDIAKVLLDSWRFAYKGIMSDALLCDLSVSSCAESWEKLISSGAEAWVMERQREIIGVSEFGKFRDKLPEFEGYGEINVIYLKSSEIGKGFGAGLMSHALENLKEQGFDKVGVWVLEKNTLAIDFYKRFGFSYSGVSKKHPSTGLVEQLYRAVLRCPQC